MNHPGDDDDEEQVAAWLPTVVIFLLTTVGTFVAQYSSGSYLTFTQVLWLVVSSILIGLAAALPAVLVRVVQPVRDAVDRVWRHLRNVRWRLVAIVATSIVLAGGFGTVAYQLLADPLKHLAAEIWGCAPAAEFTVVTTPAVRLTADELVDAFEAHTAAGNFGCPTAHGFVYDAPEDTIVAAVAGQWQAGDERAPVPQRDLGPRPDVWLTESRIPLDRLKLRQVTPDPVDDDRSYSFGVAQVVLATTATPPGDPTWPEAVRSAADRRGVVRPDPMKSAAGLLATAALYGENVLQGPQQGAPLSPDANRVAPADADRVIEEELRAAQSRFAFPDTDETAMLCHFQTLPGPRPDLLLSEQAVRRFNTPHPDDPCPLSSRPKLQTRSTQPNLDHRFVRFSWGPSGTPSAVDAFDAWMRSPDGHRAVEDTGLHATSPDPDPEQPLDKPSTTLVEQGDVVFLRTDTLLRERYAAARAPRLELLAVDVSGSMNQPAGASTRLDAVRRAVATALGRIKPADKIEIGLWVFPGDADARGPRSVVDPAGDASRRVADGLADQVPRGNTPLFQTILDAVQSLSGGGLASDRRLIVVSDGEDTASGAGVKQELLDRVRSAGVKIFVITLGDVTCGADPFTQLAVDTGGACFNPGPIEADLTTAVSG